MPVLDRLQLWNDPHPRLAAWNMAADERLLCESSLPVLRLYRWAEPTVSIGFFEPQPLDEARVVVRRLTGGGMVEHGEDLTYTVTVPAGWALAAARPAERYAEIHGAVAAAMRGVGIDCQLADSTEGPPGGACFRKPVVGDLLVDGRKVAGAGQRRTRDGLLHQGSILGVDLPYDFGAQLASLLADNVEPYIPGEDFEDRVRALAGERYASADWLERR